MYTLVTNPQKSLPQEAGAKEYAMSVAKITEISSSSTQSFEDAIKRGVQRASKTLKNIKGVWVKEQEGVVEGGEITEFRVILKLTFVLED